MELERRDKRLIGGLCAIMGIILVGGLIMRAIESHWVERSYKSLKNYAYDAKELLLYR